MMGVYCIDADKSMPIMNGGEADPINDVARCSAIATNIDADDATTSGDSHENRWEQVRSRNRTVFNTVVSFETYILLYCLSLFGTTDFRTGFFESLPTLLHQLLYFIIAILFL